MNRRLSLRFLTPAAGAVGVLVATNAQASSPLEYPDNGSASFSRGGAWLALANEPIATHYNPAGLAGAASGFSLEQQLNYNKVCFDRHGPMEANGRYAPQGPNQAQTPVMAPDGSMVPRLVYVPVCEERPSFPTTIPSMSFNWRATRRLGIGLAVVPPATYGMPDGGWGPTAKGYSYVTQEYREIPNPARYLVVDNQSTILFPTLGIGYELLDGFRLGVGFISGIAAINTSASGVSNLQNPAFDAQGDHSNEHDSLSYLQVQDLFMPGFVVSALWSVTRQIDVAAWGRYVDSVRADHGIITSVTQAYDNAGRLRDPTPCPAGSDFPTQCTGAVYNTFPDPSPGYQFGEALTKFVFPIAPEVRAGVRFHMPRTRSRLAFAEGGEVRDPLHDDVFDIELDGSYSMNSKANTIEIRFLEENGEGAADTRPTGAALPPNADRWNGFIDSYGVRLGGQWNVIQDKLGLRAGAWLETRSQDPKFLTVLLVGATRYGMGGGIVVRQDFIDISFGYQRHMSEGLDNGGKGGTRAAVAVTNEGFGPDGAGNFNLAYEPPGVTANKRTQFRTVHTVNDGSVSQSAHAFTLGGTVRF